MAYISGQGTSQSSLSVRVDGLDFAANTYSDITIYISYYSSGNSFITYSGDQGYGSNRYSGTHTFHGLSAGTRYYLFAELTRSGVLTRVPLFNNGNTPYTTDSAPVIDYPLTPSVYFHSLSGRTITWRIVPGAYNTGIYINRSWSTEDYTSTNGSTFYWSYTASSDGTYGISVQGSNAYGYSNYSGRVNVDVITLPAPLGITESLMGRHAFRLNFSGGARSTSFSVAVYEGTSATGTPVWSSYNMSTGTSYETVSGLKAGTYYYIRGYTSNSYGTSSYTTKLVRTLDPLVIGNVTNLTRSNVTTTSFRLDWTAATQATNYQIQYRVRGTTTFSDLYTTSTTLNVTGLSPATYYEVRVRGYAETTYGSYTSLLEIRTEGIVPGPLAWRVRSTGSNFDLTAKEWNDLTAKINAWRDYRQLGLKTFAVAYTNNDVTATIFNNAIDEVNALSPSYSPPAKVNVAEDATAAKINRMSDSVDSLR